MLRRPATRRLPILPKAQKRTRVFVLDEGVSEPLEVESSLNRKIVPHLLRIPLEIRQQIYSYVVVQDKRFDLRTARPPPLALVNQQLFREVAVAFLESNKFSFELEIGPPIPRSVAGIELCKETAWEWNKHRSIDEETNFVIMNSSPIPEDDRELLQVQETLHRAFWQYRRISAHGKSPWNPFPFSKSGWLGLVPSNVVIHDISFEFFDSGRILNWRHPVLSYNPRYAVLATFDKKDRHCYLEGFAYAPTCLGDIKRALEEEDMVDVNFDRIRQVVGTMANGLAGRSATCGLGLEDIRGIKRMVDCHPARHHMLEMREYYA